MIKLKCVRGEVSEGLSDFGTGCVHPEFYEVSEINHIMKRYRVTGLLPVVHQYGSLPLDRYFYGGDFTENVANVIMENKNVHNLANKALDGAGVSEGVSSDLPKGEEVRSESVKAAESTPEPPVAGV